MTISAGTNRELTPTVVPMWFVGVRVISGRVRDFTGSHRIKTGLRTIVERFRPGVRLTSQQNRI